MNAARDYTHFILPPESSSTTVSVGYAPFLSEGSYHPAERLEAVIAGRNPHLFGTPPWNRPHQADDGTIHFMEADDKSNDTGTLSPEAKIPRPWLRVGLLIR
jgi:hypothetical protein